MILKEKRQRLNLSQQQLADMSGVSISNINRIENGLQKPWEKTQADLERILGVVDWEETKRMGFYNYQLRGINFMDTEGLINPGQLPGKEIEPEPEICENCNSQAVNLQTEEKQEPKLIWSFTGQHLYEEAEPEEEEFLDTPLRRFYAEDQPIKRGADGKIAHRENEDGLLAPTHLIRKHKKL